MKFSDENIGAHKQIMTLLTERSTYETKANFFSWKIRLNDLI